VRKLKKPKKVSSSKLNKKKKKKQSKTSSQEEYLIFNPLKNFFDHEEYTKIYSSLPKIDGTHLDNIIKTKDNSNYLN